MQAGTDMETVMRAYACTHTHAYTPPLEQVKCFKASWSIP